MTDQKLNCGNCDKRNCTYHKWIKDNKSEDLRTTQWYAAVTSEVGCLSHPDARAWLMRDVIKKLTPLKDDHDNWSSEKQFVTPQIAYQRAITLIKDGVKK